MTRDGIGQLGSRMESKYAFESDRQLRHELEQQYDRDEAIQELEVATQISERQVLIELVDCGVRADSMNVITLVPLVWVAWANGYVERTERISILHAAKEVGMNPESNAYQLLGDWLKVRPDVSLVNTWKDYIGAIRRFVSAESVAALKTSTINRATQVAESAGGYFGLATISKKEQAVLEEIETVFNES